MTSRVDKPDLVAIGGDRTYYAQFGSEEASKPPPRVFEAVGAGGAIDRALTSINRVGVGALLIACSADGSVLAVAFKDRMLAIVEVASGHSDPTIPLSYEVGVLAVSDDGRRVAAGGSGGIVTVWDRDTKETRAVAAHAGAICAATFSPGGAWLASAGDDTTLRLWSAIDLAPINVLRGHAGRVEAIAFSPDGRHVATADRDGMLAVWEVAAHDDFADAGDGLIPAGPFGVAPDGRTLAVAARDGTIWIVDAATGGRLVTLPGHAGEIVALAYVPDGRTLVSVGGDRAVRFWSLTDRPSLVQTLPTATRTLVAALSADGRRLATAAADGSIHIQDFDGENPPSQSREEPAP